MDKVRPLSSAGLGRRAAPFLGVVVLAFALVPLPPSPGAHRGLIFAAVLLALIVVVTVGVPWARLPAWTESVPPLLYLGVVALMRDAEGGGISAFVPLIFVPVFWLALHGTRRQLLVAIALTAPLFLLPMLLVGGSAYTSMEVERALVAAAVALVIGLSVHGLVRQISAQAAQLAVESRTDDLTQALNRRGWDEGVEQALLRAAAREEPVCLAMLDMDNLKQVNDAFGHQAGGAVLQRAAAAWRGVIRETDILARYGGDEFGLIMPDTCLEKGVLAGERLREALDDGSDCSVGVAEWDGNEDAEHLLARADAALYEAKWAGRGRVVAATWHADYLPMDMRSRQFS